MCLLILFLVLVGLGLDVVHVLRVLARFGRGLLAVAGSCGATARWRFVGMVCELCVRGFL